VTVVVTIQGSARALKHARAPSRPGTNGGAQTESSGSANGLKGSATMAMGGVYPFAQD
jgi:hypothetical protein